MRKKEENYNGGPTWDVELGCATWSLDPNVPLHLDFVIWLCLCHNNIGVITHTFECMFGITVNMLELRKFTKICQKLYSIVFCKITAILIYSQ
jgi:hypothetical protein